MKKPLLLSACMFFTGIILGATFWTMLVAGQMGVKMPSSLWVDGVYDIKQARAAIIKEPKMVFIGGSGLLFGLDSDLLETIVHRPVLNMGVNAGLPLQMIVGRGIGSLHTGDIAVFVLEYPLYSENRDFTAGHIDFLLSHPYEFNSFPWLDKLKVLISTSWLRVLQGYTGLPAGFNLSQGLYGPHNVDAYGDQINSELNQRQPWMDESIEGSKLKHYGKEFVPDARGLRLITAITRKLESRDICVLFLPPPMLFQDEYMNDPEEKEFYEQFLDLLKSHHLTLLAKPYDFMYPQSYFFDTPFHLVDEQRQRHTQRMGELLEGAMESQCERL